jgi:extradiol dioxygenase family protein
MRAHLSINVKSLKASLEFYSKVFGVAPEKQSETYAKYDLREPVLNFSMHEAREGRMASRVNHLGIEAPSAPEVEAWSHHMEELEILTKPEENTECCFARRDKVWFQDPDGNASEVFFVREQLPVIGAEPPKKVTACGPGSGCC